MHDERRLVTFIFYFTDFLRINPWNGNQVTPWPQYIYWTFSAVGLVIHILSAALQQIIFYNQY